MYADTSILLPYFQSFSHEAHHLEEFCRNQRTCSSMGSELYALNHGCSGEVILHSDPIPLDHMLGPIVMGNFGQTSTVSDYDLGGEGDLFKAPEPIIEEPEMGLDPMTAISVVSCGEDAMSPQTMKLADLESFQSEQLLNEVFYECEKDLLAKSAIEEPFSDISDVKIPVACMDVDPIVAKDGLLPEGPIQKSISSGCLSSMEWLHGAATRPNFLDFQLVDFGDDYGLRRAFSEGDMQTLSSGNTSLTYSPFERPLTIGCYNIEERKQKLSRYRKKRTKRNFGRKIKYACRKALADSQPRVRGRFAKTEELEVSKK